MQLSETQINAINHKEGPALVLAVPGSGKTTVIIHRTRQLIEKHGVKHDRILTITFSKSSALDMKQRYVSEFPQANIQPKFSTIHSFCFKIIRDYSIKKRLSFKLIEDDKNPINKYRVIKDIYQSLFNSLITEEKMEAFLSYYGYAKNMMISPSELVEIKKLEIEEFEKMFIHYEATKQKNNFLDFDDLLTMSYQLLVDNPKALNYCRNRYDYIQLDEGQDTSKIQLELLRLLANSTHNLFIVADDDQSIYGFRGAYPQGLLSFKEFFPQGCIFYMNKNFRSSKNIVNLSNDFIQQNSLRYKKIVSTDNPYSKAVQVVKFRSIEDQYKYILKDINNSPSEKIAILYRNNLSALGLMNLLEKNKIEFYMRDVKLRFFNHWMIKDIYIFFELARDLSNLTLYEQIFYKMKGYVSRKMINWLKTRNIKRNIFKELLDYPGLSDFYRKQFLQLELDFKILCKLPPARAIKHIMDQLNYDNFIHENSMRFGYTYEQLKEMLLYLELIAAETGTYLDFKERMDVLQNLIIKSSKKWSNITLSTIHSAKGLEFDSVYIIDLIDGSFPSASSIEALEDGDNSLYEEERRLFYVAITRAKNSLTLLSYENTNGLKINPSVFLNELKTVTKK